MKNIEVEFNKELVWPNCCAYCMDQTDCHVNGKSSIISGINPLFYTRKFITIRYPVCKKHKLYSRFLSFFMHQSTVDLFVGSLFIPLLVSLPIMLIPFIKSQHYEIVLMLLFVAYLVTVITLKLKMPIKFGREINNKIKIRFANTEYAKLFVMKNH